MFIGYKVVLICVYVNKTLKSVTIQTKVLDRVLDSVVWSISLYKSAFKELSVFAFSKKKIVRPIPELVNFVCSPLT